MCKVVNIEDLKERVQSCEEMIERAIISNLNTQMLVLDHIENRLMDGINQVTALVAHEDGEEREILYAYVQEMINLFPKMQQELGHSMVSNVIKSLLLALDHLTHAQFVGKAFNRMDSQKARFILEGYLLDKKNHSFSADSLRSNFEKKFAQGLELYSIENKERLIRIKFSIKKDLGVKERFIMFSRKLIEKRLKANPDKISYHDYLSGMTNHKLHIDVLYYMKRVIYTLFWFLNSESYKKNILMPHEELELVDMLGIDLQY